MARDRKKRHRSRDRKKSKKSKKSSRRRYSSSDSYSSRSRSSSPDRSRSRRRDRYRSSDSSSDRYQSSSKRYKKTKHEDMELDSLSEHSSEKGHASPPPPKTEKVIEKREAAIKKENGSSTGNSHANSAVNSPKPVKKIQREIKYDADSLEEEARRRKVRVMQERRTKQKTEEGGEAKEKKEWNLEDDADSDTEQTTKTEVEMEDDEPDPLDAFMANLTGVATQDYKKGKKKTRVMVVKKRETEEQLLKRKGELVEGDIDAMEFSEEEDEDYLDKKYKAIQEMKAKEARRLLDPSKKLDHSTVEYRAFKKNFYIESEELKKYDQEKILEIRTSLENIKVRGKPPLVCPIQTWAQAGLRRKFMNVIKREDWESPTPIQAQALPLIMSGRDVIGIAKTGSGKTLAFLLPLMRHIEAQPPREDGEGPAALIMTPTRELALQIKKEADKFCKTIGLLCACVYGGSGISEQIGDLKRGVDIVVCTPGRMIDMLAVNGGRVINLRRCTMVVLDEADRMFDLGFEPQVTHIMDQTRPDKQTVMFSATLPSTMSNLARKILRCSPCEIVVGGKSTVPKQIIQNVAILEEEKKVLKLLELLGSHGIGQKGKGSSIVFVSRQEVADHLQQNLQQSGYSCYALHGGVDQDDRSTFISDFKMGNIKLLVATSVAARGLDVRDLGLVVNFDTPNHYEDYVHRVGRTGRAGTVGYAWTFLTQDDAKYAGDIAKAFELSEKPVPENLKKFWEDYKTEMKRQGKKIRVYSGFVGKGFKFDDAEENAIKEQRNLQKAALGLDEGDGADSINTAQDIDKQIEEKFKSRKRVRTKEHYAPLPVEQMMKKKDMENRLLPTSNEAENNKLLAMEKAKMINAKLMTKSSKAQNKAKKVVKSSYGQATPSTPISAKQIAEQMASKLNNKLNYSKTTQLDKRGLEKDRNLNPELDKVEYEEALEINDFPQSVRFKCCNRESLNTLVEVTECRITVKGRYYEPDEEDPQDENDDPRLFMEVIGDSEMKVLRAKAEITRLVKEELLRIQSRPLSNLSKSRYKVPT